MGSFHIWSKTWTVSNWTMRDVILFIISFIIAVATSALALYLFWWFVGYPLLSIVLGWFYIIV